ncbi:MAG: hypothetical protein ACTJHT_12675 [Sphingobacterium sp.]|uniref:hypothetical protein n=1 Tax=Sphingobacterium sp. JB170 TaxID=1434842 RepID=UPI00117B93A0|nr:hypothetical protein [Sphingobacterium sp. JB170]
MDLLSERTNILNNNRQRKALEQMNKNTVFFLTLITGLLLFLSAQWQYTFAKLSTSVDTHPIALLESHNYDTSETESSFEELLANHVEPLEAHSQPAPRLFRIHPTHPLPFITLAVRFPPPNGEK